LYKIPANTLFMGKNLVYLPECHSTNTLAAELAQRTAAVEGTTIVTDNQTQGRGQRGNEWFSEPAKNLTFSLIVRPVFLRPIDQFNLTMAVSLALRDFLTQHIHGPVKIKWPNDMLIRDKKVCGILIENSLAGDAIQYSIVGIGLNVNQETFSLPAASSMKIITGIDFSLADLLCSLLEFLEQRYLQLRSGKTLELRNDYLKSLYGIGEPRNFADAEGEWQGTIEGVTQHGKLLILKQGFIKSYDMKEIHFIS
jgi:BirA family transcriptional regulator, biotin operon repressor / biotin---[acetyl-CoA-carboxylase] ligase